MSIQVIPNELVLATGGRFVGGLGLTMITSVSVDHRSSVDGSLFVPLKRAGADGHRHIEEAFRRGAVGALVQRDSGAAAGLQRNYPKKILVEVEDTLAALGEISRFWCQKLRVAVVVQACSGSVDELGSLVCRIIGQSLNAQHFQGSDDDLLQLPLFLMGLNAGNRAAVVEVGTGEPERLRCLFELCDPAVVVIDDASFSGIMPERAAIVSGSDNV
ncbi:MAG: hypothetical protein GY868_18070, partial [Deltaproteobacteria bacterium]|nr:hypothetical protein [Deltaproteobacteria bacterium]